MPSFLNPLDHPIVFHVPQKLEVTEKIEHLPSLFLLLDLIRPKKFLQFGYDSDLLYTHLCDAVVQLKLNTQCHLVAPVSSTHSNANSDNVVREAAHSHDSCHVQGHSTVWTDLSRALESIEQDSIDLLFVQGHGPDLGLWEKKMSPMGVVVLEDDPGLGGPQSCLFGGLGLRFHFPCGKPPLRLDAFLTLNSEERLRWNQFLSRQGEQLRNLANLRASQFEKLELRKALELERRLGKYSSQIVTMLFESIASGGNSPLNGDSAECDIKVHPKTPVSIIIPVLNNVELTKKCLESIRANTGWPFEIIVVDDGSSERSKNELQSLRDIKLVHHASNKGFIYSCNLGASKAEGNLLLFLNNDTVVEKDWLRHLVETLERDKKIGAVGAMLLRPDGKISEAGGIIWNDGTGMNYGWGDWSSLPQYNYVREVDYCSGACLLVRKEVFQAVGGFDVRFSPAYYEDTDLCFEMRRLGYKVVYQPLSRVIHAEGSTAGTDISRGVKRFQEINRPKFIEKHQRALREQYAPGHDNCFLGRERSKGLRILLIDHKVPHPDEDSGSLRMLEMLGIFKEMGHCVTLGTHMVYSPQCYSNRVEQLGVETVRGEYLLSTYLEKFVKHFDVAILWRVPIALRYAYLIRQKSQKTKIVFDTIDLQNLQELRRAAIEGNESRMQWANFIHQSENYISLTSDSVWVVSTYERELLLKDNPSLNVSVVPLIHRVRDKVPSFESRVGLMYLGNFAHPPNEDAVLYFVESILPIIRKNLPRIGFCIVGSHPTDNIRGLASDSVTITGKVNDLGKYFDRCRVFVAPLRFGAGVKGKIGQSMAHGVPVVTTPIGIEGMGLTAGESILLADEPSQFAEEVTRVYSSKTLWESLSENGIRHTLRTTSPASMRYRLDGIFDELLGEGEASVRSKPS